MAVLAEALSTGGEGHTHLLPFGVAREGDEQIGFAIVAHHGHAILVPLLHEARPALEGGGEHHGQPHLRAWEWCVGVWVWVHSCACVVGVQQARRFVLNHAAQSWQRRTTPNAGAPLACHCHP